MDADDKLHEDLLKQMEDVKKMHEKYAKDIRDQISDNYFSHGLGKVVKDYCPQFVEKVPELMQDKEILNSLDAIKQQRERLVYFVGINIFLFIVSWLWARTYRQHSVFSFNFWFPCLTRFTIINGARLYVLYYFFSPILMPFKDYLVC